MAWGSDIHAAAGCILTRAVRRALPVALGSIVLSATVPNAVWAAPILSTALEFVGIDTSVAGRPIDNYVAHNAPVGSIGQSFRVIGISHAYALAVVSDFGEFDPGSGPETSSVIWDAQFKVNEAHLHILIGLGIWDFGSAGAYGYATADEELDGTMTVNGALELSKQISNVCNSNTSCGRGSGPDTLSKSLLLNNPPVGEIIDVAAALSASTSATAGPYCESTDLPPLCLGDAEVYSSNVLFISAIREPSGLPIFFCGLAMLLIIRGPMRFRVSRP